MNVCAVVEVVNAPARRMIAANTFIISFLSLCLITIYLLLISASFSICSLQCKFQSKTASMRQVSASRGEHWNALREILKLRLYSIFHLNE